MKLTLKAIRINMRKTQEEMAELFGVTKDVINNWENFRSYPNVKDVPNIENATGLKYDDIIFLPSNYAKSVIKKETIVQDVSNTLN